MPGFGGWWWNGGFGLQGLITVAMLVAALRRGAESWWFLVIAFFQPIGPWAYFLVEFLPGLRRAGPAFRRRPSGNGGGGWFAGGPSLAELRHRAERSPTVANHLALGESLLAKGLATEALPHAAAALAPDACYGPARHLLAQCQLKSGDAAGAAALLAELVARDPRWSAYRAWRTLIAARDALGDAPGALDAARKLERLDPTWESRCDLAARLIAADERPAAAALLDDALRDARFQPFGKRLGDWSWQRKAEQLRAQAAAK